jgi:hypothetical protein
MAHGGGQGNAADTTLFVQQLLSPGSAALPFVISTGAKRSGEICILRSIPGKEACYG